MVHKGWIIGLSITLAVVCLACLVGFPLVAALTGFTTYQLVPAQVEVKEVTSEKIVTVQVPQVTVITVEKPVWITPQAPAAPLGPSDSTDGYGLQPQPYVPHPSLYLETGHTGTDEQKTQTWTLDVLPGSTLVYGGYRVDGVNGGVYGANQGPQTVTITVTDGFVSIVTNEWAQQEYCFRVGEAEKYGWAYAHLNPLQGWSCQ